MALFKCGSKQKIIELGTNTTFDCTKITGYKNLTSDNFYVKNVSGFSDKWSPYFPYNNRDGKSQCYLTKSYNAETGVLTCYLKYYYFYFDGNGTSFHNEDRNLACNVVCIK